MPEKYVEDMTPEELHAAINWRAFQKYENRTKPIRDADHSQAFHDLCDEVIFEPSENEIDVWAHILYETRLYEELAKACHVARHDIKQEGNSHPSQTEVLERAIRNILQTEETLKNADWLESEREIKNSTGPVYVPIEMVEVEVAKLSPEQRHAVISYFAKENYLDRTERRDWKKAEDLASMMTIPVRAHSSKKHLAQNCYEKRIMDEWEGARAEVQSTQFGKTLASPEEITRAAAVIIVRKHQMLKNNDRNEAVRYVEQNQKISIPKYVLGS